MGIFLKTNRNLPEEIYSANVIEINCICQKAQRMRCNEKTLKAYTLRVNSNDSITLQS